MLVVADTSPLNYLIWIDSVEILPQLYGSVLIPLEVRDELVAADAPAIVRAWTSNLPDWVEVCATDPKLRDDSRWQFLDLGERAALALAVARQPSILLIDERRGTEVARSEGLPVTGTLGILDEASRRQLISLPEVVEHLKRTSFRYPKKVVERLLEEDAQARALQCRLRSRDALFDSADQFRTMRMKHDQFHGSSMRLKWPRPAG